MKKISSKCLIALIIISIFIFITTPSFAQQADPFEIEASNIVVMDYETGFILYEKNATEAVAPASLTKLMTMYVIFDALENGEIYLDDKVAISQKATELVPGASRVWAVPGSEVSVEELLIAVSVISANDAGIALAEKISGSEEAFVERMNETAKELELKQTNFLNSHGLDQDNHLMSARDVAKLSQRLISDFPQAIEYSSMTSYTMSYPPHTTFPSTFRDLLVRHENLDGLKTGYTGNAGRCISVTSTVNGRRYIVVLMDVEGNTNRETISNRDTLVEEILNDFIAKKFQIRNVLDANEAIESASFRSAKRGVYQVGVLEDLNLVVPREHNFLKPQIKIDKNVSAPLEKGDVVGTVEYVVDGQTVIKDPIYVLEDVPRANFLVRGFWGIIDGIGNGVKWVTNIF
ncbi:D-alanyl-D-alanine carboxypeptidase family protein [Proteinivorax hydrogeniformans]|uniref:serine-type D-Ala-D-Ala carboxypeptidase n=1 Tax=Proteinivorax hydrogeniformans TaxID=1826727 RepID=A0AAU8HQ20_9FIRM